MQPHTLRSAVIYWAFGRSPRKRQKTARRSSLTTTKQWA